MAIRVLSFGFSGLFNLHYATSQKKNVIKSNTKFLDAIKADNHLFTKNIALIGSKRQSKRTDYKNHYKSIQSKITTIGSCFPAIKEISSYLNTELNTFLLADLYGNLPHGTSFERAIVALHDEKNEIVHADWLEDDTKVTLLYAQMHKMANEYANEEIIFNFYEYKKDTLRRLKEFFKQYDNLRPPNVSLFLNHHDGDEITLYAEFIKKVKSDNSPQFIDENYLQTVKDMANITKKKLPNHDGINKPLYVSYCVTPELLDNRISKQEMPPTEQPITRAKKEIPSVQQPVAKLNVIHYEPENDLLISRSPRTLSFDKKIFKMSLEKFSFFCCKPKNFPDSYTHIWEHSKGSSNTRKVRTLLLDYTKENFLFGSFIGRIGMGHWNRHYVDAVRKILKDHYESAEDMVVSLKMLHPIEGGSLYRRIAFIEKKLEEQQRHIPDNLQNEMF